MTEKWPSPYEPRLVAFIDILGFRDIVASTGPDPNRLYTLLAAINRLRDLSDPSGHQTKQVSQFSDSIAVSFHLTEKSSVFYLLNDVAMAVIDLARNGLLVRGGVTIGWLIHNEKHLLGPAMIEAYDMESKVAKYPRVIVDPEVIEVARRFYGDQNGPDLEVEYVQKLLRSDADGVYYLDYTSWDAFLGLTGDIIGYDRYITRLSTMVEERLKSQSLSVREKALWLRTRYVEALDVLLAAPEDSDGYRENEAACKAAKLLPRFAEEALLVQEELSKRDS